MTDIEPEPVAAAFQEMLNSDVFPFFPEKRWVFCKFRRDSVRFSADSGSRMRPNACQHLVFTTRIQKHRIFRLQIEIGCTHVGRQNQCAMQIFHGEHQSLPAFWIFCVGMSGFQIKV